MGDPTLWGWAMTAAYGGAAIAAAWRQQGAAARPGTGAGGFWLVLALVVGAYALNSQLDLQTLMIATGRCLAEQAGWFELRRQVQAAVFVGFAGGGLVLLGWLAWQMPKAGRGAGWAGAGLAAMAVFATWRAAEFLHVEGETLHALSHMHIPRLFELGGAAGIATGARIGQDSG